MKKSLLLVLALSLLLILAACSGGGSAPAPAPAPAPATPAPAPAAPSAPEYVLKIGATVQDASATGKALLEYFEPYIEEHSNGRIDVQVYNNSVLGDDNTLYQSLQTNTVQASCGPLSTLANFEPKYAVCDLPFLFKDKPTAYAALDGEFGDTLKANLPNIGMRILGYGENAFRNLSNNKKEISSLADLANLKVRVMESPAHLATWRALGANPTPVPFAELYSALQNGTVDGQDNGVVLFYTSNLFEVQKFYTISQQCYAAWAIVLSEQFWQSLPADLQQVVQDGTDYTCTEQRKLNTQMEEDLLKQMQEENGLTVTYLTAEEQAKWKEAAQKAWDELADKIGPDVMAMAYAVEETYGK